VIEIVEVSRRLICSMYCSEQVLANTLRFALGLEDPLSVCLSGVAEVFRNCSGEIRPPAKDTCRCKADQFHIPPKNDWSASGILL
jgi:hypothetical protein